MLARMGAERSGIGNAASMVGAGAPDPQREMMARQLAQRGAMASGMGNAAASVGAAPSRGQMIRARLAELRAGGLSGVDAVRQAAQEGLLPASVAGQLTRAPRAVPKY
jgi:hypothetical protein